MSKSILILANKYPNTFEPTTNMFIQQLAWQFADMGLNCSVVCPMPVNINVNYVSVPRISTEITENGNEIKVYHPKYISMGQSGSILQKPRVYFTTKMYEKAVDRLIRSMSNKPDYLYSYFLCPTSVAASRLGRKYDIPAFMEHGEAEYHGDRKYGNDYLKKELVGLKGVIAVSNQNKHYVIDSGIVKEEIVEVYPNCFREERFRRIAMEEARKHFGWDPTAFIVGFAGSFDDRKGTLRLQEAVEMLDNVYFACAGSGKLVPTSERCLWAKPVLHSELPLFYNALNVFVLPTLAEGSCTATAEAIGCGCPIISSNRPFNENLCFGDNSIVVDPENIEEIAQAIEKIYLDSEMEKEMREGSLRHAEDLKQGKRMKSILAFMERQALDC